MRLQMPFMEQRDVTMVHVAAADENRGRVVLRLASAAPHRVAVEAALRVARAYQASLESIYVEDQALLDLAAHTDAHEISLCGRDRRSVSAAVLMRQFAYAAREAERRVAPMARLADIPYRARTLRDTPVHALNRACAEAGPWNVIAFADPVSARERDDLLGFIREVSDVTGFVIVAPSAARVHGPVVVVVEDSDRLLQLLRIADRLAAEAGETIHVLLAGTTEVQSADMADVARITLAQRTDIGVTVMASHDDTDVVAEAVRGLAPGFLIGRAGRALLPLDGSWGSLTRTLDCPLFIAR